MNKDTRKALELFLTVASVIAAYGTIKATFFNRKAETTHDVLKSIDERLSRLTVN